MSDVSLAQNRAKVMSEEAQKFLQALHDYLLHEYLMPIAGSIIVARISYVIGRKHMANEIDKNLSETNVAALDTITKNFQSLIAGYEARIDDLTEEIDALRQEVKILQTALNAKLFKQE